MNVLLINPPFILSECSPYSKTGANLPPLGLLYVASYLRSKHSHINIQILDSPAYKLDFEGFRERLKNYRPDVVGISIYTTTFPVVLKTVEIIKEEFPDCTIIGGGPHASIMPEECLGLLEIDAVIMGEGEVVFTSLIECLMKGEKISKVASIAYKEDGNILYTFPNSKKVDLDSLPLPARDLLDMSLYRPAQGTFKRIPSINMITSRGCPFKCSFCSKNIYGYNYRVQSPIKTIEEIEVLIKDFGIKEVIFNDDIFTIDKKRIETLCDLLIERELDLTWSCSTRVNLVDKQLLRRMKESGCVAVGFGIEAGDPGILKSIGKGVSLESTREVIQWTREAGIETRAFYILGFPGETKETIQRTIETAIELDTDFVIFNLAIPLPGTPLYEEAKSGGLLLYDGLELYTRTDGAHPLIKLNDVSGEDLVQFYRMAYKKYYFRPRYIFRQVKLIRSINDIKRYTSGFLSFLRWCG